jgi:hypothetical protein
MPFCWFKFGHGILKRTFSFSRTSGEASGGTDGQTRGLGQGSMLSKAL